MVIFCHLSLTSVFPHAASTTSCRLDVVANYSQHRVSDGALRRNAQCHRRQSPMSGTRPVLSVNLLWRSSRAMSGQTRDRTRQYKTVLGRSVSEFAMPQRRFKIFRLSITLPRTPFNRRYCCRRDSVAPTTSPTD